MTVQRVLRMGDPCLRKVARPLDPTEISSAKTSALLVDMVDTLAASGGIGLAAPQIGVSLRLAIIEIAGGPSRYGELEPLPLTIFVNPEIKVLAPATQGYWEGCLSVPGLRGFVERPQHVLVTYLNLSGEKLAMELTGFLATVFQHEFDHLDGTLFVDRLSDPTLLAYEDEYEQFIVPHDESIDIPNDTSNDTLTD
jgi:peptide deformylase